MTQARTACEHCALPARGRFCCTGCALAWFVSGGGAPSAARADERPADRLLARVVLGAFLAMGVMVVSLAIYSEELFGAEASAGADALRGLYRLGALALSLPIVWLLGAPLAASVAATRRFLSADALILAAATAALATSAWNTLVATGPVYYETTTMVLVLFGLGRWLDAQARERASAHVRALAARAAAPAARVTRSAEGEDPFEESVEQAQVRVGDVVRVRPGERAPVDGVVVSGSAFLDTSDLTGESLPRACARGDKILAGSALIDGTLDIRAERVGEGRVQAEVERLLARALASPGRFVRLADRLAAALLPTALVLAAATFAYHARISGLEAGVLAALAVVLVACPCALGIATPLAYWSALGAAWRDGVLVQGGDVLERLARARRVLFDKTGTLTGAVELTSVVPRAELDERACLALAAALEAGSEHPIAAAVRGASAGMELPPIEDFRVLPGIGVEALDGDRRLSLRRAGGRTGSDTDSDTGGGNSEPRTHVRLERDAEHLADLYFESLPVPSARAAVAELRAADLGLSVLTGDGPGPAQALGDALGLTVESELLPADKVERIERGGAPETVFVGDGLNDAAALAAAGVGVAVAHGSPRSLEAADVVLVRADLGALPRTIGRARRAVRTARWNLCWAFTYNVALIGFAVSGRLSPVGAAAAMVVSSALVVVSSSRGNADRAAEPGQGEERDSPEPVSSDAESVPREARTAGSSAHLSAGS